MMLKFYLKIISFSFFSFLPKKEKEKIEESHYLSWLFIYCPRITIIHMTIIFKAILKLAESQFRLFRFL